MKFLNINFQKVASFAFILLNLPFVGASEKATIIFAGEMTEIASDKKGGYPELATILKQHRKTATPTFFLFSGGSLGPSTLSSLDRGTHIIDLLNSLEPDAMSVAKREFSFLEDELSLRSYEAAFPLIASNLEDRFTGENLDGLVKSVIVQQGSIKMGIISTLDESVIADFAVSRIKILSKRIAVEREAKSLRDRGVKIVILMYSTFDEIVDQFIQEKVIDISMMRDEHALSEDFPDSSRQPNNVIVTGYGKFAILNIEWEEQDNSPLKMKWELKPLKNYSKDSELLRQVRNYKDRLSKLLEEEIGMLESPLDTSINITRKEENSFGSFVADSLREYTNADIALINAGTLRAERKYPARYRLLRSDIIAELPFRNKIALISVSGQQIISALENGFSLIERMKGCFPQISGMKVIFDSSKNVGSRVISVKIKGQEIDIKTQYKLATTNYLSAGGDGYESLKNLTHLKFSNQMSRLLSDVIIDSIKSKKWLRLNKDGRLIDQSRQITETDNGE